MKDTYNVLLTYLDKQNIFLYIYCLRLNLSLIYFMFMSVIAVFFSFVIWIKAHATINQDEREISAANFIIWRQIWLHTHDTGFSIHRRTEWGRGWEVIKLPPDFFLLRIKIFIFSYTSHPPSTPSRLSLNAPDSIQLNWYKSNIHHSI